MRQVTAAIIEDSGKILIARRGPTTKLAGMWEFPGGKVEEGESPEECLARELREELGIETEVGGRIAASDYEYDHGSFRILAYRTRIVGGEISLLDHDQVAWAPVDCLLDYPLLLADVPIARILQQLISR